MYLMSAPATNALSPAPVSTTTRASASSASSRSRSRSSVSVSTSSALARPGGSTVTTATASSRRRRRSRRVLRPGRAGSRRSRGRRPGREDLCHALFASAPPRPRSGSCRRPRPARRRRRSPEPVEDPRHERHVRAGEDRDADGVRVLLDRGLDDLLGRLVQPGVDDLHARVAERAGDDLRAAVVAVETGLCDHDPDLPRHVGQYMKCG